MNRIDRALEAKGLKVTDENKLTKDQRKIGNIGRLIAAARAAEQAFDAEIKALETEVRDAVKELAKSQHELADAKQDIADLTRQLAESQQRVKALELRNKVEANEFSQAQRRLLLESDTVEVSAAS